MTERSDERKKAIAGLKTFIHLVESTMDAVASRRVVRFGHGRMSAHTEDDRVEITADDIKNAGAEQGDENNENEN